MFYKDGYQPIRKKDCTKRELPKITLNCEEENTEIISELREINKKLNIIINMMKGRMDNDYMD